MRRKKSQRRPSVPFRALSLITLFIFLYAQTALAQKSGEITANSTTDEGTVSGNETFEAPQPETTKTMQNHTFQIKNRNGTVPFVPKPTRRSTQISKPTDGA